MTQLLPALPFKTSVPGHQIVVLHLRGHEIRRSGHAHCNKATTGAKMAHTHTRQGQILVVGPCQCPEEGAEAD